MAKPEKKTIIYKEGSVCPSRWTKESWGLDLYASETVRIAPQSCAVIGLGVKTNFECIVAPRSSLWKKNVIFANGIWVIDADYRGEVKAILFNFKEYGININEGDKIAQLLIHTDEADVVRVSEEEWNSWSEENPTERWEGGIGSTDAVKGEWTLQDPAVNAWDDKSENAGEEAGDDSGAESNEADDSETSGTQSVWDWTSEDWSEQSAESAEQGDEGDDKKWDVEKIEESKWGNNKTSAKEKNRRK